MSNLDFCDRVKDLLQVESRVIKRHIDRHKWFQHIRDKNEAVKDFIEKYGWLMREVYCENMCSKKDTCKVYKKVMINDNINK
jgi:hypothetical protein